MLINTKSISYVIWEKFDTGSPKVYPPVGAATTFTVRNMMVRDGIFWQVHDTINDGRPDVKGDLC